MAHSKQKLGNFGEAVAARLLQQHGYRMLERQWRCRYGEIDLILCDGDELVFVEVRACRSPRMPLESIGPIKQRRLIQLAQHYLLQHALPDTTCWRIDVVGVQIGPSGLVDQLEHIPHAVEAYET